MSSYNVMTKIHIWIGHSPKNADAFYAYFAINEADKEAEIGASQFDKDVHMDWYDEDLIGIYFNATDNNLDSALNEIAASPNVISEIHASCIAQGITEANALFYYKDAELNVPDISKKYNDLTYLGAFDNN